MSALHECSTTWLTVGRAHDIPYLQGRSVRVGERRVAIFRLAHGWAAVDHDCPHRAGPLSDGIVADACVTCPLHGQRFSLLTGDRQDADGPGVRTYEVRERDGVLELAVEA